VQAITEVLRRYGEACETLGVPRSSLRKLAAHPACPLSKSQLRDTLAAYRVYREDPTVGASRFLTPSHVAAVTSLPPADRRRLLELAEQKRLSVRELLEEAREERRRRGEKRGRPHTSRAEKAVTRFDNAVLFLEEAMELLRDAALAPELEERIAQLLDRVRGLCDSSAELLHTGPVAPRTVVGRRESRPVSIGQVYDPLKRMAV
jgi:hypothetical protein